MTVIEGDHGSTYFYPDSTAPDRQSSVNRVAAAPGGNALIGRQLYPLLVEAG